MPDRTPYVHPSEEAWNGAAEHGAAVVKFGMASYANAVIEREDNTALIAGATLGAVAELGRFSRAMTPATSHGVAEAYMIAYLRGALRGLDGPVHEDGRVFTQAYDG